jgi:hypothetical protein
MPFTPSTDHLQRALAKLLAQFQNSPKLKALLGTYIEQIQALETLAYDTALVLNVNAGEGIVLDRIGKLVGRGRMGLADVDYRYALRAQIRANRASGTAEDFIDVLMLSVDLDPTFQVETKDVGPASAEVILHGAAPATVIQVLWTSILQVKEAGVRLEFVFSTATDDFTFACDKGVAAFNARGTFDAGTGLGWAGDPGLGGQFAGEFAS